MDMDGMAMAMAAFDHDDLNQMLAGATSPARSSATSSAALPAVVAAGSSDDDAAADLRRGPWTVDEDILLVNYIAAHGEGRWNSLARSAGLKRTGKSCRLRWLNYLRPDVRRGNITADEQLLILDLHSRWGNRWSKIAQHLPGRTDNEIKNYWRTRVQKHARQLRCDVNSAVFRDVVRHLWMPRLRERAAQADRDDGQMLAAAAGCGAGGVQQAPAAAVSSLAAVQVLAPATPTTTASAPAACYGQHVVQQEGAHGGVPAASEAHHHQYYYSEPEGQMAAAAVAALSPDDVSSALRPSSSLTADDAAAYAYTSPAAMATPRNDGQGCGSTKTHGNADDVFAGSTWLELLATANGGPDDDDSSSMSVIGLPDFVGFGDLDDGLWSLQDDLCMHQQLC